MPRGRPRKYPIIPQTTESIDVKVTMNTLLACPQGVARPGTVLDLPEAKAAELKAGNFARDYKPDKDAKNPHGMQQAEK